MQLRKASFLACLLVASACLAGGYAWVRSPLGVLLVSIAALFWLYTWKPSNGWLATLCLAIFAGLAVVGVLFQAPPFLMILGVSASLTAWDLLLLDHSSAGGTQAHGSRLFERRRIQSLAAVLGVGLLAAVAGRQFTLSIPFGVMVLLALLALFSLDRAARRLG